MASDLNSVTISGNLTRDPEAKELPSGTVVADLSVACNGYSKSAGGPTVDYFDVTAFGKVAEILAERTRKGTPVALTGRLKQDRWEGEGGRRSKVKIILGSIKFYGDTYEGEEDDEPF